MTEETTTWIEAPKTGIHNDIPFEKYLKIRAMSQSVLKHGRVSMAHLKAAWDEPIVPTDDMNLGSALHAAFLEPDKLSDDVVLWDGKRRAGGAWEEFRLDNVGKIILTQGYYDKMLGMTRALRANEQVRLWKVRAVGIEISCIQNIGKTVCRGRVDVLLPSALIDLKKIASVTMKKAAVKPEKLLWHIRDFGYDLQAAFYRRLFERDRFILVFAEDAPPYSVATVELGPNMLAAADREIDELLERYEQCLKTDYWPGPFEEPLVLDEDVPITMDGEEMV